MNQPGAKVGSLAGEPVHRVLVPHSAANLFYESTTWTVQAAPASQLVARRRPKRILVTMRDGRQVILHRPRIKGDEITGRGDQAVSVAQVRTIATWETTVVARVLTWTVAAVALLALVGLLLSFSFFPF